MNQRLKKISKASDILLLHEKQEILGTSGDLNISTFTDYDLQEYINCVDNDIIYNIIYDEFKKKFIISKKDNDIYIIDFKCGHSKGDIPIRWEYRDIIKGYKYIEDEKIYFTNCLRQKSVIKLDVIYVDKEYRLYDITQNYYIKIGDDKNYNDILYDDVLRNLLIEFRTLFYDEKKYYKSLKRLYSYYKLKNNKSKIKKLQTLFNSELGIDNKLSSDLKIIILLIDNKFRKIKKDLIYNNIKLLMSLKINEKYEIYLENLIKIFKNLNISDIKNELQKIIDVIDKDINDKTLEYINKNNFLKI
jgi:hypothetical protein